MTEKRRYNLLCPIARALDIVGDRWALLILRDLHAGPARFQELEAGLGIASNLLSTRLTELTDAGLIVKVGDRGHRAYELTDLGRRTDRILWELSQFGGLVERDPEPRPAGNLRTIALPLRIVLESVADRPDLVVRLLVDDDVFTIVSSADRVDVTAGTASTAADLVVRTGYRAFLDTGEGLMSADEFVAEHLDIVEGAEHAPAFLAMLGAALAGRR